jgi:hypothetical protein
MHSAGGPASDTVLLCQYGHHTRIESKLRPIWRNSKVFQTFREAGLYANIKKCMFGVREIPLFGDFVGINGCRVDPSKVEIIRTWPIPANVGELRSWLGLATYLHRFAANFTEIATPLTHLLCKDVPWNWTSACQDAFEEIKQSLIQAPILALPDFDKPFSVVCDTSKKVLGCSLMQQDTTERPRPISFQSQQLRKAECHFPAHGLQLLAMKYALSKFRIYLVGAKPFVVYTDHASHRTAIN